MTSTFRRIGVAAATLAVVATSMAATADSATAAPAAQRLIVTYHAVGTSTIAKPNSTVALGPAKLTTRLAGDGSFVGKLPLRPTTSSFKVLGLVPVSATVTFVPVGQVTGQLTFVGAVSTVTSSASYYLKLSNVKAAGLPTPVGDSCQTAAPVTIPLATPAGQVFDLTNGGTVSGSYTIGNFANCGLLTGLFNLLVPGPGNTVSVTLSDGQAQN